jgi:hypothetical protein
MTNLNLKLTDKNLVFEVNEDQQEEITVNVLLKSLMTFESSLKSKYPNPDNIKLADAAKTLLSCWFMTPEEFERVTGDKDTEEKEERGFYMIDPPSGFKWGFPKKISYDSLIGDTVDWLIKNGYPKEEIEAAGNLFTWKIWQKPEEKEGEKK